MTNIIQSTLSYTDGSCIGNPGPGGWAFSDGNGKVEAGAIPYTTNQKAELFAIQMAVLYAPPFSELLILTDSKYCIEWLTAKRIYASGHIKRAIRPILDIAELNQLAVNPNNHWGKKAGYINGRFTFRIDWIKGKTDDLANQTHAAANSHARWVDALNKAK